MSLYPRTSARARGYTTRWDKARLSYLGEHPLCVMCERTGTLTSSCVVDHVSPHRGDDGLFWDQSNWQALCTNCHSMHKQREEHGRPKAAIGADGWPI